MAMESRAPHSTNQRRALARTAAGACALQLFVAVAADTHRPPQTVVPPGGGVVVETAPEGPGGFKAGDVLHSWVRAPRPPSHPTEARGDINSPFDLYIIEREHGQRGVVTLHGRRGEEAISAAMPSAESSLPSIDWKVWVRPQMTPSTLAAYRDGLELVAAKRPLEGAARWRQLAGDAGNQGTELAVWLFYAAGKVLSDARLVPDAVSSYREAERLATSAQPPAIAAFIANIAGRVLDNSGDLAGATETYARAVDLLAPLGKSMFLSRALVDLGNAAHDRGDLPLAERAFETALAIREEFSPGSRELAQALNNMAAVARATGAPARAHALYRRSLEILEKLIPESPQIATVLNNAGGTAVDEGDLETAEALLKRALAVRQRLEPTGRGVAQSLLTLGSLAKRRGDLATAHEFYSRALEIFLKVAPEAEGTETALLNLGAVAYAQGDFAQDEDLLRRALAIAERNAPGSLRVASVLHNLGAVARQRNDLDAATTLIQRAREIADKAAPRGRQAGLYVDSLAYVTEQRGDLKEAEVLYRRALGIWQNLSPGGEGEARVSYRLAALMRKTGRLQESANLFAAAVTALDASADRLGADDETRSRFRAARSEVYADYIDLLHAQGQDGQAFQILERSRAASLLRMLAERDILAGDLPADLVRERQRVNAEYDRVQARMSSLHVVKDSAALQQAAARLRELRAQREQIIGRVRKTSTRTGALQYPQPLSLEGTRKSLDAGTVLLSYSVGNERTLLFVVRAGASNSSLQVFTVPISATELRERVARFRSTIERQLPDPHIAAGRDLYALLIASADKLIAPAQRVLISPDGPLHSLPFAALVRSTASQAAAPSRTPPYFIAWKPLHIILSASVYAEVTQPSKRVSNGQMLMAFGDPVLPAASSSPAAASAAADIPALLRRGNQLERLPASRREVALITGLFQAAASAYLAADATEERVKEVAGRARYLHFATHGLLDEQFPLDSGLVLTRTPGAAGQGRENGVLQAWEIFDHLRLDAELVVLSACETALGAELGGEGLVGLSRAFLYAGARSVLASLWRVADDSTADLMSEFYRQLKAGQSKDVALRNAQMKLLATGTSAHPFHWAAFTLNGDWMDGAKRQGVAGIRRPR